MTAAFPPRGFVWVFNSSFPALAVVDHLLRHLCRLTHLAMIKQLHQWAREDLWISLNITKEFDMLLYNFLTSKLEIYGFHVELECLERHVFVEECKNFPWNEKYYPLSSELS